MRLYIIRHAEPDYERNSITAKGHREAKALARQLKHEGLTHLYSSPLGRAVDTARYSAKTTGLKVQVIGWTRELSDLKMAPLPPWGDRMAWDLAGEVIRLKRGHLTPRTWHRIPLFDPQKFRAEVSRVGRDSDVFVKRHGYRREAGRYRILKRNKDRIAVFCHGGFGLTWLSHLLEIPLPLMWSGFWMAPSSVTTVLFDERSERWATPRCLVFGDLSHLRVAGVEPSTHGIKANFD